MGEAPQAILLVESVDDAELVSPPQTERLAYLTQTTLSVDDTAAIVGVLRRRFPCIDAPSREDICYATTNRQRAVKAVLPEIDLLLVIGSRNSSNSNRLVEVARSNGVAAELIDDESEIDESWLVGVDCVGVTSGARLPRSISCVGSWSGSRAAASRRSTLDPTSSRTSASGSRWRCGERSTRRRLDALSCLCGREETIARTGRDRSPRRRG
jgi:4-hydroxy-3-methylbut-2-enyl diphosphate reductase